MKKLLCIVLTLCMLFAFAPCTAFAQSDEVSAEEMLGTVDKNHYTNKALGIQADVPEDWQLFGTEEAMRLMYAGFDMLEADKEWFAEQLEKNTAVFDFFASAMDNSGDNINIQVQKNQLNALQRAVVTEDKVIEASIEDLEKSLAESGMMENIVLEKDTIIFAGKEHGCVNVSATIQDVPVYERMVVLLKGNYLGYVTSFSLDEDTVTKNLDMFKAA